MAGIRKQEHKNTWHNWMIYTENKFFNWKPSLCQFYSKLMISSRKCREILIKAVHHAFTKAFMHINQIRILLHTKIYCR